MKKSTLSTMQSAEQKNFKNELFDIVDKSTISCKIKFINTSFTDFFYQKSKKNPQKFYDDNDKLKLIVKSKWHGTTQSNITITPIGGSKYQVVQYGFSNFTLFRKVPNYSLYVTFEANLE